MFGLDHSAIQEAGAGLLVTHVALAIALLVPTSHRNLSPIDSILGTMVLDAQNSALSIQLVAKQTLASRWQTATVISGQLAGLAVIGVLIDSFTKNGLATDKCKCVSAFWWGWLSNCAEGSREDQQAIWTYYAIRSITVIHSCMTAGSNTRSFDRAKKREEESPILGTTFREEDGLSRGRKYSQIAASTSLVYFEHASYSLFSLLAAEGLLTTYIHPSSPITGVGQIMALVIAVTTAIRALWVFGSICFEEPFERAWSPWNILRK
jgi:hypothetical protein